MKTYQHTQPAHAIVAGLTMVAVVYGIIGVFIHGAIVATIALFIVAYFFRSMTVEISDTELTWYFGSGFPRKRVPMSEVISAEAVRTSFWNGWGIHYTRRGWLYNVSGYGAVCVTLRNGKRFCLGSDEPEVLARELGKQS
ncbi:MAG TPA: hypothetical protein VHC44_13560 [Verrucomicrobiae bacterium]|nr:hypothetical protein [Verrucomicrobiae bacterium]